MQIDAPPKPEKTYVTVLASIDQTGLMEPREIIWPDGRKFPIDRVESISLNSDVVSIKFRIDSIVQFGSSTAEKSIPSFPKAEMDLEKRLDKLLAGFEIYDDTKYGETGTAFKIPSPFLHIASVKCPGISGRKRHPIH